jgi:hypothetical protein
VFEERFAHLKHYKAEYGDCLVPTVYEKDPQLAHSVASLRRKYQQMKKKGELQACSVGLSQDQIDRLDSIGFIWDARKGEPWDTMFQKLVKFKQRHGNCLVPTVYPQDTRLGHWVQTQRQAYKRTMKRRRGKTVDGPCLTEEHLRKLQNIGFTWDARFEFENWRGHVLHPAKR